MRINKQAVVRTTFFLVLLLAFAALAACASAESADFGSDRSKADVNTQPAAGKQPQKGSGGQPWLEINEEFGHKWKLTYEHSSATALLQVAIVNWDVERAAVTEVLYGCEYEFANSNRNGDSVKLQLDSIQDSIEDCYVQSGQAKNVPRFEKYSAIQFEVSGSFQQPTGGGLISHPTFKYGLDQSGNNVSVYISAEGDRAQITGETDNFNASGGIQDFHAASNLFFWTSLQDQNVKLSYLEHYVWTDPSKIQTTAKQEMGRVNAVVFDLGQTELEITPPNGFSLDKFVIDPKSFGAGGG
ncbi:MAG: hypothetical protein AB8G95_05045 [Anaerolineae bacterium]